MNNIKIMEIGAEGGMETIYGKKVDGVWSFWNSGTTIDLNEDDDIVWRGFSSIDKPKTELVDMLFKDWWRLCILYIHPDFEEIIKKEYEKHKDDRHWKEDRFTRYRRNR
jgi:hypothetical protein